MSQKSEISSSDGAIVLMVILVVGVVLDDSMARGPSRKDVMVSRGSGIVKKIE